MRTIEFRGQRIDNGEWVYGFLYQLPLPTGVGCMILTTDNTHEDDSIEPEYHLAFTLWVDLFPVKPETVGRFTGLLDDNGVKIFEGDIAEVISIRCEYKDFMEKMLCEIVYDNDLCCFDFLASDRQRCMCVTIPDAEIEVIGNIYDNPELLNKKN